MLPSKLRVATRRTSMLCFDCTMIMLKLLAQYDLCAAPVLAALPQKYERLLRQTAEQQQQRAAARTATGTAGSKAGVAPQAEVSAADKENVQHLQQRSPNV
jgi:hypothetical protein